MKGPPNDQDAAKEDDFSEFMWMAEENLEDFDKKVEEELQMYEALDQFELEQEATLYAEDYPPPPPRQRQQRNPRNQGYHGGNGMNNRPFYSNGYGPRHQGGMPYPPPQQAYYPNQSPAPAAAAYAQNPQAAATVAASSTLNPNAAAFELNPNAPAFVPRVQSPQAPVVSTNGASQ